MARALVLFPIGDKTRKRKDYYKMYSGLVGTKWGKGRKIPFPLYPHLLPLNVYFPDSEMLSA